MRALVVFRKTDAGKREVRITIHSSKRGSVIKRRFNFPEDIDEKNLLWTSFQGDRIAPYHRAEKNRYYGLNYTIIPTEFGQRLESMVSEVLREYPNSFYFRRPDD